MSGDDCNRLECDDDEDKWRATLGRARCGVACSCGGWTEAAGAARSIALVSRASEVSRVGMAPESLASGLLGGLGGRKGAVQAACVDTSPYLVNTFAEREVRRAERFGYLKVTVTWSNESVLDWPGRVLGRAAWDERVRYRRIDHVLARR